ncbi:MAG: Lrp/AsnC family transcriptional regulator [Candidatus Omnitrophota bacterium]|nr:Lrp/AsnC family transcriptional regulator [Candidatus Omnitrophota bacterium]
MLSALDKKVISLISQDISLTGRPFREMADRLNISEAQLLGRINGYKRSGLLRKFSAVLNHRKAGFIANAMCVWNVPEKSVARAGRIITGFSEVSHCYERKRALGWNYNLYAMVHGKTKAECLGAAKKISQKIGFSDCKILFSSKEYKKTGVKY